MKVIPSSQIDFQPVAAEGAQEVKDGARGFPCGETGL